MTLAEVRPELKPISLNGTVSELWEAYRDYTSNISPDDMAVSIKTAAMLLFLCRTIEPRQVADFGSGFTTYILARYAQEAGGVTVTSIDDDEHWLTQTGEFLTSRQLSANLTLLPDYIEADINQDLACYDLGRGTVRDGNMRLAADRTRQMVLFDDAMHHGHRETMRSVAERTGADLFFLQDDTTDQYGRFAALLVKP